MYHSTHMNLRAMIVCNQYGHTCQQVLLLRWKKLEI